MADNVEITPGSGKTVLGDEVTHPTLGTGVMQCVKLYDAAVAGATPQFPTPAALADAAANPTTPLLGVCLLVWNGATWDRYRTPSTPKDVNAVAIGTIATVWTPASGKKVRLLGGCISVSAAGTVLFEDNAGAAFMWRTPKLLADTPYNFDCGPTGPIGASANNVLKATGSAAMNLSGTLYGCEET